MAQPAVDNTSSRFLMAYAQLLAICPLALVLACVRDDPVLALGSTLLGGAVAMAIMAWFNARALTAATDTTDTTETRLLGVLYRAELGKLLLAALVLGLMFKYGDMLDRFSILLAFIVAWLVGSIAAARAGLQHAH